MAPQTPKIVAVNSRGQRGPTACTDGAATTHSKALFDVEMVLLATTESTRDNLEVELPDPGDAPPASSELIAAMTALLERLHHEHGTHQEAA